MNPGEILNEILDDVRSREGNARRPVIVFDLDHTLFDNGPRSHVILREFAQSTGRGDLDQALAGISDRGLEYLLSKTLKRVGFDDDELAKEAFVFWRERFFTDAYQAHDVPMPGALEFVSDVFAAGARIVYLTGRDVPGMLVGCISSLRESGFPVGLPETVPVLKPDFDTPDLEFKTDAVRFISSLGDVVAAFDNEPGMCNLFRESWPEGRSVLLDTEHAPNPPALKDGITSIKDFTRAT